jgi:hypothetical protein
MTTGFWTIPQELSLPRAPVSFLKEQAAALREETQGALVGLVGTIPMGPGELGYDLTLVAPTLNNYRVNVLTITHKLVPMYPVWVRTDIFTPTRETSIQTEGEFIEELRRILSSTEMEQIVAALLSQIRAPV